MLFCWWNSGLCVMCDCSWKTAVFLHDGCQCVLSTRFIVPESGGFTRVLHQCRTQQMLAWSWRLPNMQTLSLFIYLLLNDPPGAGQEGNFLCRFRRKRGSFVLSIICHWHIKVRGLKVWKSSFCLRWMPLKVFTLILISACVIPASSDTYGHASLSPLPKHLLPFLPCSPPHRFNQSNASPSRCYMGNKKDNGITHRLQHHMQLS